MTDYDPAAPGARRYPRVITPAEIHAMPRLPFEKGIGTNIFVSQEADDARHFRHGYCYQEPDHTPYHWDQTNFDESHYVLEGKIRLRVEDAKGRVIYLEAGPGEHIYLPGGYKYTLEPTGIKTVFFWTSGPSPRYGLVEVPEFSAQLTAMRK
jgi:oxalate decarboxylase/phosphoglucose isomerase-like protein (cupin superfamily)